MVNPPFSLTDLLFAGNKQVLHVTLPPLPQGNDTAKAQIDLTGNTGIKDQSSHLVLSLKKKQSHKPLKESMVCPLVIKLNLSDQQEGNKSLPVLKEEQELHHKKEQINSKEYHQANTDQTRTGPF